MKKTAFILVILVLLCSSLAACSQGKSEKTGPAEGTANSSSASPSDGKSEKIKITAMKYKYGDVPATDKSRNGIKMINERFNVDYQLSLIPQGSYSEKLSAVFASGKLPDLITFEGDDAWNRYPKFAAQGAFADLGEYIDKYPTFQIIPDYVLDQFKVDGKIYAIPTYSPKAGFTVMIRKDWLDNLGLPVPTSYDELKKAALAFTKDDPDKDGKNDTYGIALGQDINPKLNLGAYWDPNAWYHQDEQGRFIPGTIGKGFKDTIQMLADLYKEGAVTKDFVTLDWANTNKEFYSGKAGIFIAAENGMSEDYMNGLLQIDPGAKFVALDAFEAPDGSKGWTAGRGFGGFNVISAEAAKDPAKLSRIFEILDFSRTFYPPSERTDKNANYDWYLGGVGVAYDMVDGKPRFKENATAQGMNPSQYLPDGGWPEKDSDNDYPSAYKTPIMQELARKVADDHAASLWYASPDYNVISPTLIAKGTDLTKFLLDEQTKMISGQIPVSDWDKMVEEWKSKGGEQIIEEVNAGIKIKSASEGWIK
ncbi:MAG: extracellular solute-binding protein [Paenibacillus sp.]|uniref:extracellular solute-binding protein n=1 Tax=Paenibacillus sp. TaxID=58172 RepID=UPI00290558EA|nr:extracellular solute-binding protein [Paenibacillus sp.]MDU2242566.1 extracellular solute-binding protein [Paenibacillus sp.]